MTDASISGQKKTKEIVIYTDGACHGNPGPGSYAAVLMYGNHRKEISGCYRKTTNNRMEILAVVEALKALKKSDRYNVILHTDSQYVANAINKGWLRSWMKNGWRKSDNKAVLNVDLWKLLWEEFEHHNITFKWVEGHAGVEENEVCDKLCQEALLKGDFKIDDEYEKS